jgi:purine-binding chemotaxis protein CheW
MNSTALAQATEASLSNDRPDQYLIFTVARESFAIGILHIKEIIEYGQLTQVPMMPRTIRGVINLRGTVVPVIDLCACLYDEPAGIGRRSCIVIVEVEGDGKRQDMGLVVDSVTEVLDLPASRIEPTPAFGARIQTDFIEGMGKVNNRFVIVLNVDRILSEQELAHGRMSNMVLPGAEIAVEACAA